MNGVPRRLGSAWPGMCKPANAASSRQISGCSGLRKTELGDIQEPYAFAGLGNLSHM